MDFLELKNFINSQMHMQPTISDYKIINSTKTTLGGSLAQKIIMYDYLHNHTSEVMRIIAVKNGTAYRIAYYSEPGKFIDYLPIAQKMIDSFRIVGVGNITNNSLASVYLSGKSK